LSVEGQILSINEGNKTRRLMIGFGSGASEVRTLTQVYEATGGEHRLVDDFYTTAKSSRKPGFGPMSGAGAAAGRAATTAAASAGIGFASERSQTAEADAQHAAREIAKELAKFFVEQG
jgi:truncated hemoglobin YjbI